VLDERLRRLQWKEPPPGAMLYDASAFATDDCAQPISSRLLTPDGFARAERVGVGGRQAAWFVSDRFGDGVLRHYRRGGLVARISDARYVWTGEDRSRSFAEYRLLAQMVDRGLPVPQPLAAGYWRHGLTYSAALLTRRIPGARALAECLASAPLQDVAAAIVAMHRAGVWHADLNVFNIMVDQQGKVWLIDFDRSRAGGVSDSARDANLQRLARSLRKVAGENGARIATLVLQHYHDRWQG